MGQIPSRTSVEKERDILCVAQLVSQLAEKETVTWNTGFSVTPNNYNHVLGILKSYHHHCQITWKSDRANKTQGTFDGHALPSVDRDAEDDKGSIVDEWDVYPCIFTFSKRERNPKWPPIDLHHQYHAPVQPVMQQQQQHQYHAPPVEAAVQQHQYYAAPNPHNSAYQQPPENPSAPADSYTFIEWKNREYKAELTAMGSYEMFLRTKNDAYNRQAGEWKKVKNLAQDQKVSKQEFDQRQARLYEQPYNLPIDKDVKDYAQYMVLHAWITRDGTDQDRERLFGEYPSFKNFAEFERYCNENPNIMPRLAIELNKVSCAIQQARPENQRGH